MMLIRWMTVGLILGGWAVTTTNSQALDRIGVSADGSHFVTLPSGERFVPWGVNYDHDHEGRLLDEYWDIDWAVVEEDFAEIKALGANLVRIHLQLGLFMKSPTEANEEALSRLTKLIELAERTGLYIDITGLACYHKQHIPAWFDALDESARWDAQATFWEAIAKTCRQRQAVFCYDLMNEPILPGEKPETEWLGGELGGKFFVQRISLSLQGRTREQVAKAWVDKLVAAIRRHDSSTMVTVGVIPWVFVFGGGKPLFHSPEVGEKLDFVAVHFYPKKDQVEKALTGLKAYDVGKPLLIEEMFPLECSPDELMTFVHRSSEFADGWVSFYWGKTETELQAQASPTIGETITAQWLKRFSHEARSIATAVTSEK